jgi:uncharacterized protein with FMN-binding domain
MVGMARNGSNQKVANKLVVMSSAAVLAVYAAGYVRTRPAADRLAQQTVERSLAREAPANDAASENSAAAPIPAASAHPEPKRITSEAPKLVASSAPVKAIVPAPNAEAAPSPAETPAPVSAPVSTPVASITPIAPQPAEAPAAVPTPAPAAPAQIAWKDGKYVAWGGSRHGDIEATVVIESGRIVSAEISNCQTRYPCDIIDKLPPQVVKRQSPNVDRVGGATESADAFYSAVFFALKQAQ